MPKRWSVRLGVEEFNIIRWSDASELERNAAIPAARACLQTAQYFPDWWRDDPFSRSRLLRICHALSATPGFASNRVSTRWLKEQVELAMSQHRLIVAPKMQTG